MPYQKLRGKTIEEYCQIFIETYCNKKNPIITFDDITVKFYSDMFEHAFYESANWKKGDKTLFSFNRAERILWIKDALEDSTAILKVGWDKENKSYNYSRRVAIVKNNYVVIIWIRSEKEAKFITAYEAYDSISSILSGPDWEGFKNKKR
jgi:hypothetical protein